MAKENINSQPGLIGKRTQEIGPVKELILSEGPRAFSSPSVDLAQLAKMMAGWKSELVLYCQNAVLYQARVYSTGRLIGIVFVGYLDHGVLACALMSKSDVKLSSVEEDLVRLGYRKEVPDTSLSAPKGEQNGTGGHTLGVEKLVTGVLNNTGIRGRNE